VRLFFALHLPPDLRETLARWQRAQADGEGWSRPEGLHLTLAFLGERPAEAPANLAPLAATVAAHHCAFTLRTAGLGGFPGSDRARLLWLGMAPCPALEALAADLRGALAAADEPCDAKPFRAHVTLARFRHPRPVAAFAAPPPAQIVADRLVLFERRAQRCYTPRQAWNFGEV
jgi:2'-5' RNA ligase